jgi:hypothetical protein
MDKKAFKKHLHDLVHGHHHPEEHDWPERGARAAGKTKPACKRATAAKRKRATK